MGVVLEAAVLRAANINPATYLATDYLNHFNEVAMMVGMLADMPELSEAVLEWTPIEYGDHFHNTGFRDKELAIAAYSAAPPVVRERFEISKSIVDQAIIDVQEQIRKGEEAAAAAASESPRLFELIAKVGGIINADVGETSHNPDQAEVDSLFD